MSFQDQLLHFIRTDLAGNDAHQIDEQTPLIDSGLIDSMALMRLISFVEERTSVRIPDDEVVPDNFQTVSDIALLVSRIRAR
jgi:acyl carrier protein